MAGPFQMVTFTLISIALTDNIYLSSDTDKRYSYSDTCKDKTSVSSAVTLN